MVNQPTTEKPVRRANALLGVEHEFFIWKWRKDGGRVPVNAHSLSHSFTDVEKKDFYHIGADVGKNQMEVATLPSAAFLDHLFALQRMEALLVRQGIGISYVYEFADPPKIEALDHYVKRIEGLEREVPGSKALVEYEMAANAAVQINRALPDGGMENEENQERFFAWRCIATHFLAFLQPEHARQRNELYTWCSWYRSPHTWITLEQVRNLRQFVKDNVMQLTEPVDPAKPKGAWRVVTRRNTHCLSPAQLGAIYWDVRWMGAEDFRGKRTPEAERMELHCLRSMPPRKVHVALIFFDAVDRWIGETPIDRIPALTEEAWAEHRRNGTCHTELRGIFTELWQQAGLPAASEETTEPAEESATA